MMIDNIPTLPKFVDLDGVCAATSLSRSAIYRLFDSGALRRCKLGKKVVVLESDLRDFIHSKVAEADQQAA